jgi:uncharacterized protein (TIGR02246 family)
MSAHKPEDWPGHFERHLNAGDLEAIVALYEPNASFVPQSGEVVVGRDGIRRVLAGLIGRKARLHGTVIKVVTAGEVALLYTDWQGTIVEKSGEAVELHSRAIEIVRRQPDGTWKLLVGDPNGRG